ncbi:MAG: glycosyltransferase family A protein [Opitutaceae bacterium]
MATELNQVGVVIPVYNRPTLLIETLAYVFAQTHQPTKLVIADDGSTDGTPDILEAWLADQEQDIDCVVLRLDKGTAANARAQGFQEVRELPYVAFLDSDDHWPTDFLERSVQALIDNPTSVLATADRHYNIHNDEKTQSKAGQELIHNPIPWLFKNGGGIASCSLLRTSAYLKTGGWKPEFYYSEDTLLFCLMALQGPFVHVEGTPVAFQIGNTKGLTEEGNLSRRYLDAEMRWATQLEKIYAIVIGECPKVNRKPLKKALGNRWLYAGRRQRSLKDYDNARHCFKRSIRWQPCVIEAWRRYLKSARKARAVKT